MSQTALEARGLAVPGRLDACDLDLPAGCLVAVVGPNGAGKSSLLQALAGLLPARGDVRWGGQPLPSIPALERGRRLAWVPQESHVEFAFPVRDVVAQGRFAWDDDGRGVEEALAAMDLRHLAARPITQLSGGERARTFLARALATEARLQLWDEPLAQLDVRHALEVLDLARARASAGATVAISVHDLRLAHRMDQVLLLHHGKLEACGPPEQVLTPETLSRVFGVRARIEPGLSLSLEPGPA
jgi:iron complex transport system ATP-binding protein